MKNKKSLLLLLISLVCLSNLVSQNDSLSLEIVVQRGHYKPITCVDYSNNGQFIASGGSDYSLKLWNAKNGYEIRSFPFHSQSVIEVKFSPDDKLLASVAWDNQIIVQKVETGEKLWSKEFEYISPRTVTFSNDGKYVVFGDNRDKLYVLKSETGEVVKKGKKNFSGEVSEKWFSSNNLLPFAGGRDTIKVTNLDSGQEIYTITPDKPHGFAFSSDDKYLAVGSEKLLTEVYELETGKKLHTLISDTINYCTGCNTRLIFQNKGNLLLSGSYKNGYSLWNAKSGKKMRTIDLSKETLKKDIGSIVHLEFSYDDRYFLLQSSKTLLVYETKSGKLQYELERNNLDHYLVHFSKHRNSLLIAEDRYFISEISIPSKKKLVECKGYLNTKDNKSELSYDKWYRSGQMYYISRKTGVAVSPDNKWIVKGSVDSSVFVIDFKTGFFKKKLTGHSKLTYLFKFSPDGKLLATAGAGREIIIWDTETWNIKGTLEGHVGTIYDIEFNKDGSELLSTSWDGYIISWNLETYRPKLWIGKRGDRSSYVASYLPGELYVIHGNLEKEIRIIERTTNKIYKELIGHTGLLSSVRFDEEEKMIFTSSWDGMLKGWDLNSQMMQFSLEPHGQSIFSLCYDENRKWLFSGGADNEIQILNVKSKEVVTRLKGHHAPVTSLNKTKDGKYLVSSGSDGEVKVWDLNEFTELYSYNQIDQNNWLVTNPSGYFDGSKKALKLVNYVKGTQVVPISTLFNKYYTPNLSKRIMEGEKFSSTDKGFQEQMNSIPQMEVAYSSSDNYILEEQDHSLRSKTNYVYFDLKASSPSKQQHLIRIYRNGKLIKNELVNKKDDFMVRHFPVRLVDGENKISFVAVNDLQAHSVEEVIDINYDGEKGKTELYIISVGMNEYQNASYNLNFAVDDAKAFSKRIVNGSDTLFNKTHNYFVKNSNKEELVSTLEKISQEIGPEDVFVFFYAGHGVMRHEVDSSEFFLVLEDVTSMHGNYESLVEKGFSAHDLMEASRKISAEKQLYVLDACNSGGVLQTVAHRGADREKALAQLAHSTGTFFLTASQDAQYANEAWELKHGVFTYCLLEVLSGSDKGSAEDQKITVSELKSYVEGRVPEVSEEYQGSTQYPTSFGFGQDFPLIILR